MPGYEPAKLGGKPGGIDGTLALGRGEDVDWGIGDEDGGLFWSLGEGDCLGFLSGGWQTGESASAGLTLIVPTDPKSGLLGGDLLTGFCSYSGFLHKFSGVSGVFGLLTKDRGSDNDALCSSLVGLGDEPFTETGDFDSETGDLAWIEWAGTDEREDTVEEEDADEGLTNDKGSALCLVGGNLSWGIWAWLDGELSFLGSGLMFIMSVSSLLQALASNSSGLLRDGELV